MNATSYADRVIFHTDSEVMEVDFSDLTFTDSPMVDAVYDEIDRKIEATGRSWYFLVNYRNCRIYELAWIRFAQRGKRLNLAHSLGSVRFSVQEELGATIEASARSENFDPNLFPSREAALAEIERMKSARA